MPRIRGAFILPFLWYNIHERVNYMNFVLKHASPEYVWNRILHVHGQYHKTLKHFGYNYTRFIPDDARIREMFEKEHLTTEQEKYYHDILVNEIYDKNDLNKFDDVILNQVIPLMQRGVEKLKPMLKSWNATLPDTVQIVCDYGRGGSYRYEAPYGITFRCTGFRGNHFGMAGLFIHEFVHILIEKPIIEKYQVPQDLKERIVDIICLEFFNRPVQKSFENSFANAYITRDAIEHDLPGAVAKMMADFTKLQRQQQAEK